MLVHTNDFKQNIKLFGREINAKIYYYNNYNLITESGDKLLTEDNLELLSEQFNILDKTEISNENIYSIDIIKNGKLLQSLMKECNFNAKTDIKIGTLINPQLGILVNGSYEYLDYGNYIIYSKEYDADTETYRYVCYDKMLYSMVKYKPLNISYPVTIRNYINAICNEIGLTFANSSDTFTNYDELIYSDVFKNQNLTYRDILDKLSEITASNIFINKDDELEIGYPITTNDTIDESFIRNTNVTFKEKFGAINKIAIVDSSTNITYSKQDDNSIETNGLTQISIIDNLLTLNGNSETICQAILNKLNGLYYYLNDYETTGVCYYEYLDLYNVQIDSETYQCLLLNNEIHIKSGINEKIFTIKEENIETDSNNYELSTPNNKTIFFKMNQQEGQLELKVEKNGVISSINQSPEEITINANKINIKGTISAINNDTTTTINGNKITTGTITANQVASDIITTTNFSAQNINADNITTGTLSADKINGGTINASAISLKGVSLASNSSTIGGFNVTNSHLRAGNNTRGYIGIGTDLYGTTPSFYAENGNGDYWTVVNYNGGLTNGSYGWSSGSLKEYKKNIEKFNNGINIIKNIDIYKYNLKHEKDDTKKHIGLIIDKDYNYSNNVTNIDNNGVELYSFISVCCQAIKEQQAIIEDLQQRISKLEKENK